MQKGEKSHDYESYLAEMEAISMELIFKRTPNKERKAYEKNNMYYSDCGVCGFV